MIPEMAPDFRSGSTEVCDQPGSLNEFQILYLRELVPNIHARSSDIRFKFVTHFNSVRFRFMEPWSPFLKVQEQPRPKILCANMIFMTSVYLHNLIARSYIFSLTEDSFIRNRRNFVPSQMKLSSIKFVWIGIYVLCRVSTICYWATQIFVFPPPQLLHFFKNFSFTL